MFLASWDHIVICLICLAVHHVAQSKTLALVQELSKLTLSEEHPMAWSLLAQQAERNGVARRELLECCNQELRRRQRNASELLEEDRGRRA